MSEDLTGKRLGNYRIDGVLGKGGMSTMYRATDVRLGRKVALKVIAEHLTADPEFRERFVDEARNTSAIDHSNVVPLYDFGEVDGLLYIAMRMVDGSDLAKLIAPGPLAPSRGVALLTQVGAALDMLHERGLVHLDVKPANVLVTTKESADEHIYLADFGLTRRGATGHRTRSGDFLGSPTYAAPEHLRGEPVDARTDQYSLACVLYACLTGRPPYRGQVPDVISGHLGGEIPKVTSVVELPEAIDAVLAKGMAKRSGDRYPSCRALILAAKETFAGMAEPDRAPRLRRAGAGSAASEQHRGAVGVQNAQSGASQNGQIAPVHSGAPGLGQQGAGGESNSAGGRGMTSGWPPGPNQGQPQQGQPAQGQPQQGQPPQGQQQSQPQQGQPYQGQQQGQPAQGPRQGQPPQGQQQGQPGQYYQGPPPPGQHPYGQGPGMGRPSQQPYPAQQGYPPQYPGQQQGFAPYGGHPQEPMRLRAPIPAGSNAFGPPAAKQSGAKRWLWPVIIGAVVVIVAVVLIILFTRDSGNGGGSGGGSGQINVPTNGQTTALRPPPTKLPGT